MISFGVSAKGLEKISLDQVTQLAYQAQDNTISIDRRVTALIALSDYPSQNSLVAIARGLQHQDKRMREAAIVGSKPYNIEHRWRMVSPLLQDKNIAVRRAAVFNLVQDYEHLSLNQQEEMFVGIHEVIRSLQDQNSKELLANIYRLTLQTEQAQELYQQLLHEQPTETVWLNYADSYRIQEQNKKALNILKRGIDNYPNSAMLHYSMALTEVRLGDKKRAAEAMNQAAMLAQINSYYWYLNGIIQETFSIDKAELSLQKAYQLSGEPEQLYALCDLYVRYNNQQYKACLDQLSQWVPESVINEMQLKLSKNISYK